jgi:hypothetical protein
VASIRLEYDGVLCQNRDFIAIGACKPDPRTIKDDL